MKYLRAIKEVIAKLSFGRNGSIRNFHKRCLVHLKNLKELKFMHSRLITSIRNHNYKMNINNLNKLVFTKFNKIIVNFNLSSKLLSLENLYELLVL